MEKHIDNKHMGCMAGFFHIFDRHQLKRIHSAKRLPPSSEANSSPESDKFGVSPPVSTELDKHHPAPAPEVVKSPLPLPVFEFKEGTRCSWKFAREAPRLSLDSRAIVDAKGSLHPREIPTNTPISTNINPEDGADNDSDQQRRSTSVIARLMGLEPLLDSDSQPAKKPELRRSASESRVPRDFLQYRFFDSNFQRKHSNSQHNKPNLDERSSNGGQVDPKEFGVRNGKKCLRPKKSFYDSADFFPEPKHGVSAYGEIEKRLKMRGIDEPSKDLETLKQILEALQLKGLLHSKKPTTTQQTNQRNFVFDGSVSANDSPIVVTKPVRCPGSLNRNGRAGMIGSPPSILRSSPRAHRNETVSPRRQRPESQSRVRNPSSPTSGVKSPKRSKIVSGESPRKMNEAVDSRRVSQVHSPRIGSRRNNNMVEQQQQGTNLSPRMRKPSYHKEKVLSASEVEYSSTISDSTLQTDTERYKLEEYREGRNLLERCDKLLHSIAEMTETESQPSPVSVLDSSFYKDDSSTPSPLIKRCIDYKDQAGELENYVWSEAMSSMGDASEGSDFLYVMEILRASNYLPEDCDVFLLLEKQQYLKGKDTSKVSTLERRLIFDTIHEILKRNRQLPPWKVNSRVEQTPSVQRIWSELRRIQERDESEEDLFEVICGVLKKDLTEDAVNGWLESPVEKSDVVLDIERLIFKDLVGETIRDMATIADQHNNILTLRRKLVF